MVAWSFICGKTHSFDFDDESYTRNASCALNFDIYVFIFFKYTGSIGSYSVLSVVHSTVIYSCPIYSLMSPSDILPHVTSVLCSLTYECHVHLCS